MTRDQNKDPSADRRPLSSRDTHMAQRFARWLSSTSITPNQISAASIVAALIACLFFVASTALAGWAQSWCYVMVAIACQLRLVCNLMDGMVAIEAGKQTADGAVWNELPDRVADVLMFAGLGFAASWPSLGWAAATLAVFVSYVRELGKGIDGVVDFSGPMAKQHRMALVTAVAILAAVLNVLPIDSTDGVLSQWILNASLWVLITGCLITLYRRTSSLLERLQP